MGLLGEQHLPAQHGQHSTAWSAQHGQHSMAAAQHGQHSMVSTAWSAQHGQHSMVSTAWSLLYGLRGELVAGVVSAGWMTCIACIHGVSPCSTSFVLQLPDHCGEATSSSQAGSLQCHIKCICA